MLKEVHSLTVFQNRVLIRTFGPKRDIVTGWWRELYNEELHEMYSTSDDQIKKDGMCKPCSIDGETRNAYTILVGNAEGKRP
jgi:hypothetical protein